MGLQPFCFWGWVAEARDPNVGRCPTRRSAALPGLSRLADWLIALLYGFLYTRFGRWRGKTRSSQLLTATFQQDTE